jgi:hypothetical protein
MAADEGLVLRKEAERNKALGTSTLLKLVAGVAFTTVAMFVVLGLTANLLLRLRWPLELVVVVCAFTVLVYVALGIWSAKVGEAEAEAIALMTRGRAERRESERLEMEGARLAPRSVPPGTTSGSLLVLGPASLLAAWRAWQARTGIDADLARRCAALLEQARAEDAPTDADPEAVAVLVLLGLARTRTDDAGRLVVRPTGVSRGRAGRDSQRAGPPPPTDLPAA